MSTFSKIRGFFGRHRGKFLVGGIIVTGSIILTKYAQQKLKDWQERETKEFLERTRKLQHFDNTEKTCNQTIMSLAATLHKTLNSEVETQLIINELKSNAENMQKMKLWHQLRVGVMTRVTSMIYLSVMLVVLLRIQLNIIGGHVFKDANSVSTNAQEVYLNLCNNLLGDGLKKIVKIIEEQYDKILPKTALDKKMKLRDFDDLFWTIENAIAAQENNPIERFKDYVITNIPAIEDISLVNMIRDTADLLESDEVKSLSLHCLHRGFILLSDELSSFYLNNGEKVNGENCTRNGFVHPGEVEIPFGKVLPILNAMTSNGSMPETLMTQLIMNERLKTLGANVYECFSAPSTVA